MQFVLIGALDAAGRAEGAEPQEGRGGRLGLGFDEAARHECHREVPHPRWGPVEDARQLERAGHPEHRREVTVGQAAPDRERLARALIRSGSSDVLTTTCPRDVHHRRDEDDPDHGRAHVTSPPAPWIDDRTDTSRLHAARTLTAMTHDGAPPGAPAPGVAATASARAAPGVPEDPASSRPGLSEGGSDVIPWRGDRPAKTCPGDSRPAA